jgi:hypothetical protein
MRLERSDVTGRMDAAGRALSWPNSTIRLASPSSKLRCSRWTPTPSSIDFYDDMQAAVGELCNKARRLQRSLSPLAPG